MGYRAGLLPGDCGAAGEFLPVGSLEEGRLLAVGGKGFLLLEGAVEAGLPPPAPRPAAAKRQAPSAQLLRLLEPGKIQVTMWRNLQNCWGKSFPRRRK